MSNSVKTSIMLPTDVLGELKLQAEVLGIPMSVALTLGAIRFGMDYHEVLRTKQTKTERKALKKIYQRMIDQLDE